MIHNSCKLKWYILKFPFIFLIIILDTILFIISKIKWCQFCIIKFQNKTLFSSENEKIENQVAECEEEDIISFEPNLHKGKPPSFAHFTEVIQCLPNSDFIGIWWEWIYQRYHVFQCTSLPKSNIRSVIPAPPDITCENLCTFVYLIGHYLSGWYYWPMGDYTL